MAADTKRKICPQGSSGRKVEYAVDTFRACRVVLLSVCRAQPVSNGGNEQHFAVLLRLVVFLYVCALYTNTICYCTVH